MLLKYKEQIQKISRSVFWWCFLYYLLREDIKYYFADFVRKRGKKSYGFGGYPPLRIFFPAKKELRIWGVPPPFTDKIRKVVFDRLPKWVTFFASELLTEERGFPNDLMLRSGHSQGDICRITKCPFF